MLVDLLTSLIGGLFGGWLSRRSTNRRDERLRSENAVRCGLRDKNWPESSPSDGWRGGTAELSAGGIRLAGVTLQVVSVDKTSSRRPTSRETWSSVDPDMVIVTINSPRGAYEWAVPEGSLGWAVATITGG